MHAQNSRPGLSRSRSPLEGRRFWLAVGLLFVLAIWHDHGRSVIPPAVGQNVEPAIGAAPENSDTADATGVDTAVADDAARKPIVTDEHAAGHADPVAPVLAAIVVILLLAKVGGDIFERLRLPAVLGELVLGILLGNFLFLTGSHALDFMQPPVMGAHVDSSGITVGESLQILAGIGVVLLLFEVGLESTVRQMFSVGASSLTVALIGVIAPIALGYAVCRVFFFDSWQQPIFIGATLCATSVGITARVLKDLHRGRDRESRIILGAAVLDDVLGLIVLAVAAGVIQAADRSGGSGELPWGEITKTIIWAFAFLGGALLLSALGIPRTAFRVVGFLRGHGLLIATALVICFGMAYLANLVGLATIVGAFAAGLILEPAHYEDLARREKVELEEALHPLTALLVPVFFVQTGMNVKLDAMADPSTWILAGSLTVIAVIGKLACSLGVVERNLNRLAIGLGMIPRGEVGLIFADQGRRLTTGGEPVIDDSTFSAIVFMVMVTTLVAPPLLRWSLKRGGDSMHPPGTDAEP